MFSSRNLTIAIVAITVTIAGQATHAAGSTGSLVTAALSMGAATMGGCIAGDANCPSDPEDDMADPQGDSMPDGDGLGGSCGLGLHVNIANGNVWTEVPILTLNGGGEEVAVRTGVLVHEYDERAVEQFVRIRVDLSMACAREPERMPHQPVDKHLRRVSAGVPANVDHHALAIQLRIEPPVEEHHAAGRHVRNVDIPDLAVCLLGDVLPIPADPVRVPQLVLLAEAHGRHHHVPGALAGGAVVDGQERRLAGRFSKLASNVRSVGKGSWLTARM